MRTYRGPEENDVNVRALAGRLATVALALAVLVIPSVGARAASVALPNSMALSRCYTNQLVINPASSSGAAGTIALLFKIHNRSSRACTLYGYPGAQLQNARHQNMPTYVHRGPPYFLGLKPRLVHLAAGGNAFFVFKWSHIPSGNAPCPTSPYIRITPPNDYSSLLVTLGARNGIDACGGNLTVTPVVSYRIGI
jgi:hypothetical protein